MSILIFRRPADVGNTLIRNQVWTITIDELSDSSIDHTFDNTIRGDALYVDDSADTNDNKAVLTGTTLTGLDMPSISEVQSIFIQAAAGT